MVSGGAWSGAAQGLATGLALGQNNKEIEAKKQLLLQNQMQEKVATYGKMLDAGAANLQKLISEQQDRSDPRSQQIIDTYRDQLIQTAKIISTLNPTAGQHYEQLINTVHTSTKDKATAATEARLSQQREMDADIAMLKGSQPQATVGAQAPAGPAAPPPGPEMTPPNQQVAEEPTAGLTSQAAAQPPMPAMDLPAPVATPAPPVGGAPAAPMPAAAPQMDPMEQQYRRRVFESKYPPTYQEKQQTDFTLKKYDELQTKAFSAERVMRALDRAEQLRAEGIFTGTGAEAKLLAYQTADPDNEWVKRTNEYKSLMGSLLGDQLKAFGSATAISNLDLTTVKQYIGQEITMSDKSLREILKIGRIAAEEQIELFNRFSQQNGLKGMEAPGGGMKSPADGGQPEFTPDAEGWIPLPGGARMRLKPGQ
jgi:hypothetical protein